MKLITSIALASTLTFAGGAASISLWDVLSEPHLHLVARFASAPADQSVGETNPASIYGAWGFDISGVDMIAKPGDSFFDYANGAWDARTAIPADKPRFGMFDALRDKVQEQLRLTSGYRRLRREVLNAGPLAADETVRRVRRHIDAFEERYDDWLVGQHADPFVRLRQLKVGENEDAVMVFEAVDTAAAAAAVTGCLALGLQSDTGGSPESSSYVFVLRQKRI